MQIHLVKTGFLIVSVPFVFGGFLIMTLMLIGLGICFGGNYGTVHVKSTLFPDYLTRIGF